MSDPNPYEQATAVQYDSLQDVIDADVGDMAETLTRVAGRVAADGGVPQNSPVANARTNTTDQPATTSGPNLSMGAQIQNQRGASNSVDWGDIMGGGRFDADMMGRYSEQYGGDRDIYDALGYDRNPDVDAYKQAYEREDIARRVVDAYPNTTWRERPEITDDEGDEEDELTPFEQDIQELFDETQALRHLKDVDRLSGIGEYGVLVYGLHDDGELVDPVETGALGSDSESGVEGVAHFTALAQDRVERIFVGDDPDREDYAQPVGYEIDFTPNDDGENEVVPLSSVGASDNPQRGSDDVDSSPSGSRVNGREFVNADRVLHVAEDKLDSNIKGTPRLQPVWNRFNDLWKVVGAAAEMFYRGADYGLHLNAEGEVANPDELINEVMDYLHGLQPYLKTENMDVERLGGEDVDPSGPIDSILKLISGQTGIPKRMLTGSERGDLASTQDKATFYGRVAERQQQYAEPQILREFIGDMIRFGVVRLPAGSDSIEDPASYTATWPNLFELNEVERAEVSSKLTGAAQSAAKTLMTAELFTAGEIRQEFFGMKPEIGTEVDVEDGGDGSGAPDDGAPEDDAEPGDRPGDSGETGADGLPELDEDDENVTGQFSVIGDASSAYEQPHERR
jgi:hypothetical protein